MMEKQIGLSKQPQKLDCFSCPLLNKEISDIDCYELSLVAEEEIKVSALRTDMRPDETDSQWRERCIQCKYHPQ